MMSKKQISKQITEASWKSLFKESDKGCLLLAVGLLDLVLTSILESAVSINLKSTVPKGLKDNLFGENGALHTFSSKVNISYAFAGISKEHSKALHVLRKLRNEAAHCAFEFTFDDPGVVSHLSQLEHYNLDAFRKAFGELSKEKPLPCKKEKFRFVVCCFVLFMQLMEVLKVAIQRKRLAPGDSKGAPDDFGN